MNLELIKADITTLHLDAIVNAANSSLMGGGGVDGAIHSKGGPKILEQCMRIRDKQGRCATGEAVITTGGRLPVKWIIHTVGPIWNKYEAEEKKKQLADCYRNSLKLAYEHGARSIAFPCISTGVYMFPKEEAARIAMNTVVEAEHAEAFKPLLFVCYDDESYRIYQRLLFEL
jgi:O-acetyl-ADP-ribose deacetylase (regulator of RNase III)